MQSSERGPRRWSLVSRLTSVLMLSASLVAGSTGAAFARDGRATAAAHAWEAVRRLGPSAPARSAPAAAASRRRRPIARRLRRRQRPDRQRQPRAATPNAGANSNTNVNGNQRQHQPHRERPAEHCGEARRAPRCARPRTPMAAVGTTRTTPTRYHRYRPYGFGVGFYPFGAFVATMAATAIAVSLGQHVVLLQRGVWYTPASGGYTVVTAPVGATVATVPTERGHRQRRRTPTITAAATTTRPPAVTRSPRRRPARWSRTFPRAARRSRSATRST